MYFRKYMSPAGELLLLSDGVSLTGLRFGGEPGAASEYPDLPVFRQTICWLDHYFRGEEDRAALPALSPVGTPFQKRVWEILLRIPYGQTRTYGDIAREIAAEGSGKISAQAVGQAVGRNPICILIPCHRVVGAKGQLTGFSGGMHNKIWLLRHEGHDY